MRIVVLMGGVSSEREVSLNSGRNIAAALRENGHEVVALDTVLPFTQLEQPREVGAEEIQHGEQNLLQLLLHPEIQQADFIFNALHGGSGENGIVQGYLEALGYRFNGSSHEGCAITMDKVVTKMIFEYHGVPTPRWLYFDANNGLSFAEMQNAITAKFDFPLVIKPGHEGSTVGLSIVKKPDEIEGALRLAQNYNGTIVVEEFIAGREITLSILGDQALPLVEIRPKHGIYDYECKYTSGMSEYLVPAEIEPAVIKKINAWGLKAFKALRCHGYGRFDIRLNTANQPYFLEFNSLPGMTALSLVPKAARALGISFNELLERIIKLGMERTA